MLDLGPTCGLSTIEQLAALAAGSQQATDLVARFLAELDPVEAGRVVTMTRVDPRTVQAVCECGYGIGAYVPLDRQAQGQSSVFLAEWVLTNHECAAKGRRS